ncbi:MAG: peptidase M14 [Allomuricauda sp.]|nr:MAG: peptidase M14 [Allomuricauda sp.]
MNALKFIIPFFIMIATTNAQNDLTSQLYDSYEKFKEPSLEKRRIKYPQIQPLIDRLRNNSKFEVKKVGESIEGRDLNLISIGSGATKVFLWSQMHGDEPTATQALFDIFNFLDAKDFEEEKQLILSKLSLHFLPMLNPDGAEVFQRRNALGIDINRDALRLQSPEGQTLKKVRDSLEAKFGFNLHDQSRYYNAERTEKPATISYLAPAYNYEKEINEIRGDAMKVIVFMNDIIQQYAPGQVGRYNDTFEPRAFGDNLTKWGTGVILIESGGYANDREKQEIRKLNYVSILSALYTMAMESYKEISLEAYEEIPRNDRKMFDLKIVNATYELEGNKFQIDLGINYNEVDLEGHQDFYYKSLLVDQGDLSTYYGYETFDATGYTIVPPKIGNKPAANDAQLKKGIAFGISDLPATGFHTNAMLNMVPKSFKLPNFQLQPGQNPNFFLEKNGVLTHAIINGFLLDLGKPLDQQQFGNALIFR